MRTNFNLIFFGVITIIIVFMGVQFMGLTNAKSKNGKAYIITSNTRNGDETYTASEIISQDDHCVTYVDAVMGLKHTVCGNYISVTEL